MLALAAIASRLSLPSWAVKLGLALLAACLVALIVTVSAWQLRTYAENQTKTAVTLASNAARADVVAKVNAASATIARQQNEAAAREMAVLSRDQVEDAAMWSAVDQTLNHISEIPDAPISASVSNPQGFDLLDPLSPVGPFLPASRPRPAPTHIQPLRAPPTVRSRIPGLADLVGADRAADRLLERASTVER